MSRYFKHQELIILDASQDKHQIVLNSLYPIDKMRISVFDDVQNLNFKPLILIHSDLTNSVIGTAAYNFIPNAGFNSQMKPLNGIEYYYHNKMVINGSYNIWFTDLNNQPYTGFTDNIYLLFEYYA